MVAAICTTISFIPQALKTLKTKQTKDLSLSMYSMFTIGIVLWLIYGILVRDIPLMVANVITLVFTSMILILKIKHK
jgi:MtN3 and saliva related transmembrane protein